MLSPPSSRKSQDNEVFSEYDRNSNFIPDDFLPDIVPRSAIQELQRPSCMGFVRDRIANTLFYIYIYICVCVCVCVCILLGNFAIKPHTKSILTKHKKLFFFNHNFNRSFNQTHQNLK